MISKALLSLSLFIELILIGGLVAVLALGGIPEQPGIVIWASGIVLVLSASIVFSLPSRWSRIIAHRLAMLLASIVFVLPFIWLVSTTFEYSEETFVFPPKWIPSVPQAVQRSPYVLNSDSASALSDATWDAVRSMLPPEEIEHIGATAARSALAMRLNNSAAPPSRELVREAWADVYRGVAIGTLTARDRAGNTTPIPDDVIRWNSNPHLITYDFSKSDHVDVVGRVDRARLPRDFAAISIPIRQDRSWHALSVRIRANGRTYESIDALHLGAKGWVEWTFKLADVDDRDERNIGVWCVYPTTQNAMTIARENDPIEVSLRIDRLPRWRATWAKYTQTYRTAWYADPHWPRYLLNSLFLVFANVAGQMLACSMVAFAFARLRWPGRDALFLILLGTMMLPAQVTMIPSFLIFKSIGWYNTLLPLWAPSFTGSAFFIFMLRQFMKAIPRELEEAALIDGCSWFGIYWRVILPLMRPALAAVAIFTFMNVWNDFLGPLIYLNDERHYPLSMGLFNFRTSHSNDFGMLMAASTMMTLPVIALFFLAQRYFIQGVTLTGLKA